MKILIVNKFLYPHGGSETYILDIGKKLEQKGQEVQYFGMEDSQRTVGNHIESYTSNMDFHTGGIQKILYPFKILYSLEARKKIRVVLDDFQPDVVHLNNINFQITPSIIYEIRKWEKQKKCAVKIVYTAHDSQWVCPNHLLMIPSTKELCFKCKGEKYGECIKNKCIHNSLVKSFLGTMEAYLYKVLKTYKKVDTVIAPSYFMKTMLENNSAIADRIEVLHNYCDTKEKRKNEKKDYVLYFGRFSEEKGIEVLLEVCKQLPEVKFIFAGDGPLRNKVDELPNVKNTGFLNGEQLNNVISQAKFAVVPSVVYENCPFAAIESQKLGTPVIGSNIGGIPELIEEGRTGELFETGNTAQLKEKILSLWNDGAKCKRYSDNCLKKEFSNLDQYCERLMEIYG